MCEPATIAAATAIGSSLGSTYLNARAANQVNQARADTLAAERERQQGLQAQSQLLHDDSVAQFETGKEKVEADGARRAAAYQAPSTGAADLMPATTSAPTAEATNIAVQDAKSYTDGIGEARGRMEGLGGFLTEAGQQMGRNKSEQAMLGSFMTGSQNVLPFELENAQNAGNGAKQWAGLLEGVGDIAMVAATGGFGGAGGGGGLGGLGFGRNAVSAAGGRNISSWVPGQGKPFGHQVGGLLAGAYK